MKTRSKQPRPKGLKREQPDIWDLWEARGVTLPDDATLERLSRGETVEPKPEADGEQLLLFAIGGRLVAAPGTDGG